MVDRRDSLVMKDRQYSGYAYSEENNAASGLVRHVRRSTKKLIRDGQL